MWTVVVPAASLVVGAESCLIRKVVPPCAAPIACCFSGSRSCAEVRATTIDAADERRFTYMMLDSDI